MSFRAEVGVLSAVACLVVGMTLSGPARAADDSEALFNSAVDAFGRHDYRAAAVLFERAFAQSKLGPVIYNAGMSWKLAGEQARAADALARALELGGLDATQQAQAVTAYGEATKSLGKIRVSGPEGTSVSVAHLEGAPLPVVVHLPPGHHTIVVRLRDGTVAKHTVESRLEEPAVLEVPEPITAAPAPSARSAELEPAPTRERGSTQVLLGWVSVGAGVIAGGVGTYFQLAALGDRDEWDELGNAREHVEVRDRAETKNRIAIGSFIASGVLVATGVTLLITAPDANSERLALSVGPGTLRLHGRF
jgi:hypothetical protein